LCVGPHPPGFSLPRRRGGGGGPPPPPPPAVPAFRYRTVSGRSYRRLSEPRSDCSPPTSHRGTRSRIPCDGASWHSVVTFCRLWWQHARAGRDAHAGHVGPRNSAHVVIGFGVGRRGSRTPTRRSGLLAGGNDQPLSFAASSVWGVNTRFRLEVPMILRRDWSLCTHRMCVGVLGRTPVRPAQVLPSDAPAG
jgi:hypothetical protein